MCACLAEVDGGRRHFSGSRERTLDFRFPPWAETKFDDKTRGGIRLSISNPVHVGLW